MSGFAAAGYALGLIGSMFGLQSAITSFARAQHQRKYQDETLHLLREINRKLPNDKSRPVELGRYGDPDYRDFA